MWIDTHAHLDMPQFDEDRHLVIQRALRENVQNIITVGVDYETSRQAVQLAETYPSLCAAVGIHPHEATGFVEDDLEKLVELSQNEKVVGWGEIGLDFFKLHSPVQDQIKAFDSQLRVAVELNLPVIIHDRDSHEDTIRILKKFARRDRAGVVHCFSGDMDLAQELFALGFFISISGTVTYKNAAMIREIAARVALEKLLIETDAPFLAPAPFRGKRNEPAFVTITGRMIAKIRGISEEKFAEATTANAKYLFGI